MVRCHADTVEVRRRDDEPEQFLWRERLYVVRQVLAHWVESGQWWSAASGAALLAGEHVAVGSEPGRAGSATAPAQLDDGERDMWRVEASAGQFAGTGVYDLCFDWSRGGWRLVRIAD